MKPKKTKVEKTCQSLTELQKQRSGIIKMMNAQRNQIIAYIARLVGYNSFQDEEDRTKNWKTAKELFKGKSTQDNHLKKVASIIAKPVQAVNLSLEMLDYERKAVEKGMSEMVKQLPVYDWWVAERGRADLGLAIIIGEAGSITNYDNPAKLWKRFGVAVLPNEKEELVRQGGLSKTSPKEAWIEHGYCRRRRSSLWTIGDCLIKTNSGRYKAVYDERKKYEQQRNNNGMKPIQIHRRAQRYMEKRLLRDLWNEWNKN